MKKIVFIVTAAIGLMVGASSASAAAVDYPPTPTPWITGPQTVEPLGSVTINVGNAVAGETVTLTIGGQTFSTTADSSGTSNPSATTTYGTATFVLRAASTPAVYPATATLSDSGVTLNTSVTVAKTGGPTTTKPHKPPYKKLPATGGGDNTGMMAFGGSMLVGGAALVFAAKRRKATV